MTNIFLTVTAGRTGTGYLQQLFTTIPGFVSVHEPSIPTENFWERRLKEIQEYNTDNYIETSHLICKGWIEPLLEYGIVPNLIMLTRPARFVSMSLVALNTIPNRTRLGRVYLLAPNENTLTTLDTPEDLNDYQLCYWYCIEIEERQRYYNSLIRQLGGKTFNTSIEMLKQTNHFCDMLDHFSIQYTDRTLSEYEELRRRVVNDKKRNKRQSIEYPSDELSKLEDEVVRRTHINKRI